jgi:hypothetical protein
MMVEMVKTVSLSTASKTELQISWIAAAPYITFVSCGRLRQRQAAVIGRLVLAGGLVRRSSPA